MREPQSVLSAREKGDLDLITKMYRQQKIHFQSKDCRESIPNRIVSISKPYARPIVKGKESKSVEFGAKVNNIQADGMSFMEENKEKDLVSSGTCKREGDGDGRLVRDAQRAP